ncbi:FliO/MopB family protein [Piscinibacter sakaiensis]|uniref:Flagellar biosynthesis protein FliO n=1 Tax=Piscinibacter sakaiensis TaxID=1547922 RepID=A0A0K8P6U0_PISS1|nr:flagellar biosynthetic protein FliO [Piscinibacter sakaiensis]GAP38234.1 flagellar biosynthesis protein FliO [Piscinibacter sakaiensis]
MNSASSLTPLLWFLAVLALIPLALWLLRRTPLGGASGHGLRTIGTLPLSPNQRLLTVEVGHGEERRWLVLGVSPGSITTLHTMAPQDEAPGAAPAGPAAAPPFAQLLARLRPPGGPR